MFLTIEDMTEAELNALNSETFLNEFGDEDYLMSAEADDDEDWPLPY